MEHWSNYWNSTQALNSFAEGRQGEGYQDEVADFWHKKFSSIPSNAAVVDLGTGNGAIAVLAKAYAQKNNKNWSVTGIDAADIQPKSLKLKDKQTTDFLQTINFIGNTRIEDAPFEQESVDAFISQFAFEYSNLEQSLSKCAWCLKPNGVIHLLSHHPSSHISKDSTDGALVIQYILQESPAFIQADLLLETAAQYTKANKMHNWANSPRRQKITSTLHWIFSQLTDRYNKNQGTEYWCSSTIRHITEILKQVGVVPPSQLKKYLEDAFLNLDAHKSRLQDQSKASLSHDRVELIKAFCSNNNLLFNISDFYVEDELFAHQITITKQ